MRTTEQSSHYDHLDAMSTLEILQGINAEDRGVAAFIVIGHPANSPEAPKRKEVSELVTYLS